ncbi:MAG: HIT domain-containing protein [candidate division WOR-3 bacterium]|jgi:ATP adenylyltransferase
MFILWAPWRFKYIENVNNKDECIFCTKPKEEPSVNNLVLYKSKHSFIILNLFPYNTGHLMVAPYKHTSKVYDLTQEEWIDIINLLNLSVRIVEDVYKPQAFNIGLNIGRVAGAGIEEHLHIHIVPRWAGDTNFMPVISNTKVIPESLEDTYNKLKKRLEEII